MASRPGGAKSSWTLAEALFSMGMVGAGGVEPPALPCQLTRAYRCATRRFPSSRSTVDGKVKCCLVEGPFARAERGRGRQKPPGQLHSARSLLTTLGPPPTFTCTDNYYAPLRRTTSQVQHRPAQHQHTG